MHSLLYIIFACLAISAVDAAEKKVVCYFGSWSVYRPGLGKFSIDDIDANLCTHFIYTFVGLDGDNIKILDPWQDLPDGYGKDGFRRFNSLRKKNPAAKTLIAIGGWTEGSKNYSKMAADSISRGNFARNAVAFVKTHGFDGFDVDWEYPAQRGGKRQDVKNYVLLLKELRKEFSKEGLLLSAALGAAKFSASQSYDIPEISKYLDFMNLMAYDFHGPWEHFVGINAPLHHASSDNAGARQMTVQASVEYWLAQGAPAEKIILGIASYGRSFTLADSNEHDVGDPASGNGKAGPYTREPGSLGYNEICEMQMKENWIMRFDQERRVPYTYRGDQWVGYDNIKSVKEKAGYINKMGLGGGMIWSIETDDFRGVCGEKYPLIRSLRYILRKGSN